MTKASQGRRLIELLRQKPYTYGEMQRLGISTSPQKRVLECLADDERIIKTKGADGLIRWKVKTVRLERT